MAVIATFTPASGLLNVIADNLANSVSVRRDAAGKLLVNGGAVSIVGGSSTIANTFLIQIFGQGDNDILTLNEASGALPRALLFGGAGNDTATGGSGADQLFGQSGNDTLLGKGGADFLFGGIDNDTLTGGDGNDQVFGESGNDRMIWNPGDDTDLFEGGTGTDTAEVNGGGGAEVFTVTANGTRVRFDRLDPAPFALDVGTTENLVVNMNGGNDRFSATGNLAALIKVTVDGGAGNDTILGSNGSDVLIGGDGNDFIDGQQGNDVAFLGTGDDEFQWDPGDGSDTVEGQAGTDTLLFNASNAAEIVELGANGGRTRFTRNIGTITLDLDDVEKVRINAVGGADTIIVGNLAGTDVKEIAIDLAGTIGGGGGDALADTVIAAASAAADTISVIGSGSSYSVLGLSSLVTVTRSEGANDSLVINALGGNDLIDASTLPAGTVKLTIDSGIGIDSVFGSKGADVILAGEGGDTIDGNQGNDVAFLGAGDDLFIWNVGDGSDTIEGQAGADKLYFMGSNASENIDISANGGRIRFFRDVANITMDADDVEAVSFAAFGGADNIVVGDMTGTDLARVNLKLSGTAGGTLGDGFVDAVRVNATQGVDTVQVKLISGSIAVTGLAAETRIYQADATDRLVVNGLGGGDVIDASALEAGNIALEVNGGLGDDLVLGSKGSDAVNGGDGNDTALLGDGDDTFVWNPGDDNDVVEGQAGTDLLLFNGSNAAENVALTANGGRVSFFRDVAAVTMDLNDVETVRFLAFGGADSISIGDLAGTDAKTITIDLRAAGGAGDGQIDTVFISGTSGEDAIAVTTVGGVVKVTGLTAEVQILGFESMDKLIINSLAGDDVVDASNLDVGIVFQADGGNDDDVLIGGDGADTLLGGLGDDVLIGGPGIDMLDGGSGTNIIIA